MPALGPSRHSPPWGWFPCFLLQEAFRILSGGLKLLHPLMWVVCAHGLFCLLTSMWWSSKWAPCFSFQHLLQHPGRKRLEFPPSEHPRSVFQCSVGITPPRAPGAGGVEPGRPQMSCSLPGHCTDGVPGAQRGGLFATVSYGEWQSRVLRFQFPGWLWNRWVEAERILWKHQCGAQGGSGCSSRILDVHLTEEDYHGSSRAAPRRELWGWC